MEFYKRKTKDVENNYIKTINKKILFIVLIIIVYFFVFMSIKFHLDLPDVYFSISKNKVVAVVSADGKELPLNPLPKKHKEIIYVK